MCEQSRTRLGRVAILGAAAIVVALVERQWTTVSAMGLLRPSMVLFLLWLGLLSLERRRSAILPASAQVALESPGG